MKRTFALILAALAAAALFGGLVYAVLVAAHVSEPAATTVHGPTPRRLWATAVAVLGLGSVVIGGLALCRSARRIGTGNGGRGALVALVAGRIAAGNRGRDLFGRPRRPRRRRRAAGGCAAPLPRRG